MKCEICKTIERLGLNDSAHDLWYCPDATVGRTALRRSRGYLQQIGRQIRFLARVNSRAYRAWVGAHARLVTLGL
ncbi:MAG TPA: hypothetical protein VIB39_15730 [Candidatus Angelobacter sp.]